MRNLLLLSVLGLLLGNIFFSGCTVEKKPENSFTLIRLVKIDSVTEQNKGWAIANYLHADLNKDSIFSSDNGFERYNHHRTHPSISAVTGTIKGFSKDSTIIKFLQRSKSMAAHKKKIIDPIPGRYGRQPYVLVIREGSHQQIINFTEYDSDYIIEYVIGYLEGLPSNKKMKPTATDSNLDKILIPLLSQPELATLTRNDFGEETSELVNEIK